MTTQLSRRSSRPYRQRRPLPALLLIAGLCAVGLIVWLKVLDMTTDVDETVACDPPASAPPGQIYTRVGYDYLDKTQPVSPTNLKIHVLNSSGQRGQASLIRDRLMQLGFGTGPEGDKALPKPKNDPSYEKRSASCRGQIRFGPKGEKAARTLSMAVNCVELIRDSRKDASVDLAVGSDLDLVTPSKEGSYVLAKLRSSGGKKLHLDDELLDAAHSTNC